MHVWAKPYQKASLIFPFLSDCSSFPVDHDFSILLHRMTITWMHQRTIRNLCNGDNQLKVAFFFPGSKAASIEAAIFLVPGAECEVQPGKGRRADLPTSLWGTYGAVGLFCFLFRVIGLWVELPCHFWRSLHKTASCVTSNITVLHTGFWCTSGTTCRQVLWGSKKTQKQRSRVLSGQRSRPLLSTSATYIVWIYIPLRTLKTQILFQANSTAVSLWAFTFWSCHRRQIYRLWKREHRISQPVSLGND